jgi:hypothetical protein
MEQAVKGPSLDVAEDQPSTSERRREAGAAAMVWSSGVRLS